MTLPRNFTVCKTAFAGKPRSYGIEADRQIWEDFNPVGRKLGAGDFAGDRSGKKSGKVEMDVGGFAD